MKIKIKNKTLDEVRALPKEKHRRPKKHRAFWRALLKLVSIPDIKKTHFKCERIGMEKLGKDEPALFLMNHSSFIDLEIIATLLSRRPYNIVTTTDAFIGKDFWLRMIGCIPTKKFVHDPSLIRDIIHVVKHLDSSVVMYPEASYSFDGTATPIPNSVAQLVKLLGIPVVMIRTYGAFSRDPLYNNLQVRKVDVSAKEEYILSPSEIADMSADEINEILNRHFTYDSFKWQQDNRIKISEPFRADHLNRVLYKCPVCKTEGKMKGEGTEIVCLACGKIHTLDEYGFLEAPDGKPAFTHIPDWYAWERNEVRHEIEGGTYSMDIPVEILMTVDTKNLYRVGDGRLTHDRSGFKLTGCDGKLEYEHHPFSSYSLYSDFYWYEVGDIICIGNHHELYYCIPKCGGDIVAKARLAAEELYKVLVAEKAERASQDAACRKKNEA